MQLQTEKKEREKGKGHRERERESKRLRKRKEGKAENTLRRASLGGMLWGFPYQETGDSNKNSNLIHSLNKTKFY